MSTRLKLAIQKKGRLSEKSLELLKLCGFDYDLSGERLLVSIKNFDLDILFLRDDDIPEYVQDGVADIGIVGEDVLFEANMEIDVIKKMGFAGCTLMIALPENSPINTPADLSGKRVATSHIRILEDYFKREGINAKAITLSGSVEIAPGLGIADAICDIVSTGTTLRMNKLKPAFPVFKSEAVLIGTKNLENDVQKSELMRELLLRVDSVLTAKNSKYIMMNVPKISIEKVLGFLPALSSPTILSLADPSMLAVQTVIPAKEFWKIAPDLKQAGATGILLLSIENIV